MHILVTNDDGITSPGLMALANAMKSLGDVSILAPDHNWSAGGHVKTLHKPLRVAEAWLADGTPALTSSGAPSDCVALALLGRIEEPIDLVVSGVNRGGNMGHDVTYSGTVTAAMEAVIAGTPGFAFSLATMGQVAEWDFEPAAEIARQVVATAMAEGIPQDMLLNVNVPPVPSAEIKGIRVTRQGERVYGDALDRRTDPRGLPYYWIGGDYPSGVAEDGTDYGAVVDGFVSVTPLKLDLTDYQLAQELAAWKWE